MVKFRSHCVQDINFIFVYQTLLTANIAPCFLLGSSLPTTTEPPMTEAGNSMLKKRACMLILATPLPPPPPPSNHVYDGYIKWALYFLETSLVFVNHAMLKVNFAPFVPLLQLDQI